ncbi:MAG: hypothetical protein RIS21_223, partial [Planctomycetota bacterium]
MIATVTISNTSGSSISSGTTVDTNSLPFDHAALVTSLQSRADGYDFRLTDSAGKVAGLVSLANANTATARLRFNLIDNLANGGTVVYTLAHGNLGKQVSPFTATASGDAAVGMAIAWASPALPVPSFPLGYALPRIADESSYPEALSVRVNYRNNTPRRRYAISWASITADEWYEIRAFLYAQRGGSYTFT